VIYVGHEPRVLRDGQLRLFDWAYVDDRPISTITRIAGLPGDRATVERLRRIAVRVESHVVAALAGHVHEGPHLESVLDGRLSPDSLNNGPAEVCGELARAFRAIAALDP